MKIAVCVEQVIDTSMPMVVAPSNTELVNEGLYHMVNPADECALEEALRIKEARPNTEVILLSLGPPQVEWTLRHCLAMGADRAVRLWDDAIANTDALTTARVLARAVKRLEADLVLCGSQSQDMGGGQVPSMVAEFLDLPQVTAVARLELSADASSAHLHRKLQRGDREAVECPLPALFSVEPGVNKPRYPSVRRFLQALKRPVNTMGLGDLGMTPSEIDPGAALTKLMGLAPPRPRPKKTMTLDSSLSAEDRLKMLLSGGMSQKKGDLWEGTPQELARRLVDHLRREGFLPV